MSTTCFPQVYRAGGSAQTYAKVDEYEHLQPVLLGSTNVTQITSITTGVVNNALSGSITTVSTTLAASTSETFTVSNLNVHGATTYMAASTILASVCNYSGTITTDGQPSVIVSGITNGAFNIIITNNNPTNALAGTLTIGFLVLS